MALVKGPEEGKGVQFRKPGGKMPWERLSQILFIFFFCITVCKIFWEGWMEEKPRGFLVMDGSLGLVKGPEVRWVCTGLTGPRLGCLM